MFTPDLELIIILGIPADQTNGDATNSQEDQNGIEGTPLDDVVADLILAILFGDDEEDEEEEEISLWLTSASVKTEFDEQGRPTSVTSDSSVQLVSGLPSELPEVGHHVEIAIGYYEPEEIENGTAVLSSISVESLYVEEVVEETDDETDAAALEEEVLENDETGAQTQAAAEVSETSVPE